MKWPKSITMIRHDKTVFQELKEKKQKDELYLKFLKKWRENPLDIEIINIAKQIHNKFVLKFSDSSTPLAKNKETHAETTALKLKQIINLPDIIFISPYLRTRQTLNRLIFKWPELKTVKIYEDELIREQERGLESLYNDWRVFFTLNPEQKKLYNKEGQYWYRYPQGENIPDVRLRNSIWLNNLKNKFYKKNILVITHYVSIIATIANLNNFNDKQVMNFIKKEEPDTCGVTFFENNHGQLKLKEYNKKFY